MAWFTSSPLISQALWASERGFKRCLTKALTLRMGYPFLHLYPRVLQEEGPEVEAFHLVCVGEP